MKLGVGVDVQPCDPAITTKQEALMRQIAEGRNPFAEWGEEGTKAIGFGGRKIRVAAQARAVRIAHVRRLESLGMVRIVDEASHGKRLQAAELTEKGVEFVKARMHAETEGGGDHGEEK